MLYLKLGPDNFKIQHFALFLNINQSKLEYLVWGVTSRCTILHSAFMTRSPHEFPSR